MTKVTRLTFDQSGGLERRRVHRDQNVGRIASRGNVGRTKVDLKRDYANALAILILALRHHRNLKNLYYHEDLAEIKEYQILTLRESFH